MLAPKMAQGSEDGRERKERQIEEDYHMCDCVGDWWLELWAEGVKYSHKGI